MGSEHTTPRRLTLFKSGSFDPYANLAWEETLARAVDAGEWLLYLWRNERTVVVGRNQNAWRECAVDVLRADGGHLARRRSGGGAVYQDLGNLNFTFACPADEYDLARNLEVVCRAVRSFGVDAEVSGRNDVTVRGAKFSGNAFSRAGGMQVHHGTLMVDVDGAALARYLRPDVRKLRAKGVESVRSRVVNLSEVAPAIDVSALEDALVAAFSAVGGGEVEPFDEGRVDAAFLERSRRELSSWEWRLGAVRDFTHVFDGRFPWGGLELRLKMSRGRVASAQAFSDALDVGFVDEMARALVGCRFAADDLACAIADAAADDLACETADAAADDSTRPQATGRSARSERPRAVAGSGLRRIMATDAAALIRQEFAGA